MGSSCSDNNAETTRDTCQEQGTCLGVNLCINVTCSPSGAECEVAAQCDPETGSCAPVFDDAGAACDDGNPDTGPDRCMASSSGAVSCGGPSLCANITCPPPAEKCRLSGVCERGDCIYPLMAVGTPCDDGVLGEGCLRFV